MLSERLIDARWIGAAFAEDPELGLPALPRLPPEVLVLPFGNDSLIFVGAREKQLLQGRSARTLVPLVLPLLDGRHTLDELAGALPEQPEHVVRDVVALLYHRGLLEDGCASEPPTELRPVDAFLGRYNDVTRINRNRGEALARLLAATVAVGGDPALAAQVAASLRACGVREVRAGEGGKPEPRCDLVVVVATSRCDDALLDGAYGAGVLSLGTWVGRDRVVVGPLSVPGQSGCYRCLRRHGLPDGEPDEAVASFWAQMAALRAVLLLSRVSIATPFDFCQVFKLKDGGSAAEQWPLPRTPGCDRCGLPPPHLDEGGSGFQAWSLYTATSKPPRALLGVKDYEVHYNPANLELARQEVPPCPGTRPFPLPPPRPLLASAWIDEAAPALEITVEEVATLVARAAGLHAVSPSIHRRVAPTGGDLGSVELGVAATRVVGLEPGVYRYHAPTHRLERFVAQIDEDLRRALGTAGPLPALVLVGLGSLARVFEKYGNFAYRIVHFDAGVAAAYLHRLAAALGLAACELAEFRDDALAQLFFLDFDHAAQVPTFAIGFDVEGAALPPVSPWPLRQLVNAVTARQGGGPRLTRTLPSGGPWAPLGGLDEALLGRRSVRSYSRAPVPAGLLRELCALGLRAAQRRIECGAPAAAAVHLVLAVVDGRSDLDGGIYAIFPAAPETLVPRRHGLSRDDLLATLLQSAHADASAVLFVVGDLGAALADRGARGLRELMLQAGAVVGDVWLAAAAHGLGGCAAGGVIEAGLTALAGGDGYRQAPLLAIALGYPQRASPE